MARRYEARLGKKEAFDLIKIKRTRTSRSLGEDSRNRKSINSEIWLIYNDFIYEITTYKELDTMLSQIMQTWRFAK